MSLFGTIMTKLFGAGHPAVASADAAAPAAANAPAPASAAAAPAAEQSSAATAQTAPSPSAAPTPVDVGAVLTKLAAEKSEKLDWRHSIVDLMKVLDMDSSLTARKQLAGELHYTGDTNDSATMNMWLHKQVMQKVAENGGTVPDELKH